MGGVGVIFIHDLDEKIFEGINQLSDCWKIVFIAMMVLIPSFIYGLTLI